MKISTGERILGVVGYILFFFIIPLKVKKDSMFVQFHARQSGVLFGLFALVNLVLLIVLAFVDSSPIASSIVIGAMLIVTGYYLLMVLIGIFKVSVGERYRMPVVADVALALRL